MTRSAAGAALSGIAEHLLEWQLATGGQRILITGPGRQVGRTATLLALVRKLIEQSACAILLVDAGCDERPGDALASSKSDTASCVEAPEQCDGASPPDAPAIQTVIPGRLWAASLSRLMETSEGAPEAGHSTFGVNAGPLLVLIDGGACETLDCGTWLRPGVLDGIIEIRRYADAPGESAFEQQREAAGIPVLGVIETLAPLAPR